jgi:hypothetical protein
MAAVKDEVDAVFERLAAGQLAEPTGKPQSGWEMSLPSGKSVTRSMLQAEAQPLVALGADAVPELLPWVENENPALRYVAAYALEQITGEKPYLPHFAQGDDEGHRAKAVDAWRKWYEARTREQERDD